MPKWNWLQPPKQAVEQGFTKLAFYDDFTDSNTIAPARATASGYKWYWGVGSYAANTSYWTVLPTNNAWSLSNGNTGGGSNASPFGGLVELTGPGGSNDAIITVPGGAMNVSGQTTPPIAGQGCWQHFYVEVYAQVNAANIGSTTANGWPAIWMWNRESLAGYGFGSSGVNSSSSTEVDIWEFFDTQFSDPTGSQAGTIHTPGGAACSGNACVSLYSNTSGDSNWHTYGALWYLTSLPGATAAGQVTAYIDNVSTGSAAPTGSGAASAVNIENSNLFLILGGSKASGAQMYVDWVRVWTAP